MPDKKDEPKVEKADNDAGYKHDKFLPVVGGLVVLFLVLFVGVGIGTWRHTREVGFKSVSMMNGGMAREHMGGRFLASGPINSANRVNGVVTAVNGASFTVAGFGSSTNVLTNSSTQYQNGDSVKANDTVTVFGTTNNGTLTATQVVINP